MPPATLFEASTRLVALPLAPVIAPAAEVTVLATVAFSRVSDTASTLTFAPATTLESTIRAKAPAPGTPSKDDSKGSPSNVSSAFSKLPLETSQPMLLKANMPPMAVSPVEVFEFSVASSTVA